MSDLKNRLPRYTCHKVVHAAQIGSITRTATEGTMLMVTQLNGSTLAIGVDDEWVAKHKPEPDGYFVVYEDGYKSWSPKEAFEDGYTLLFAEDGE